ncbi:type II secretion system F family protein [Patescibacteria group bacterium]|nr:type II secretion system F family protein [Candidatus Falkowbacteria bacterium]MBU3906314.1 type II secretion system F family protein [Patescibacteria group bacterium]MBU4015597.1 type II secretion system F family protein [Patescibacteria group bacterium]MBU4027133.1 type II secretion system F family protein [Patescibacteria group bacterium]MBU4072722.1 type II secretion system F family protein [Patescibacteria group bacterium]
MPIFKYKAIDISGKTAGGIVEAVNQNKAAEALQEKKYSIISIKEISAAKKKGLPFLDRIKIKDVAIFSRQFSVMMSANVAMVQSLRILTNQTVNSKLKLIISEIAEEVDSGSKLSTALAKRPKIFSNFYVSVVSSGETSGKLDEVLNYLADEMEKDYDMMSKIKGAMIYPVFVLAGLSAVGVVMMVYVVPKLTDILTESGAELPLATRVLIGISGALTSYWWLIILVLGGLIAGIKFYISKPLGRKQFDFLKLRIPIFGKLFQRIYIVRFTRSMHTLIIGGVTIVSSLKIAADIVDNRIYYELISQTIKEVEDGNSISSIFIKSKEMPMMVSQMMSVGERTGKMDIILERLTDFYDREINNIVANLMTLMEPVIMVVIGAAVGMMVAAIILPMYNMAGQF